jgi:DGQHR domain-containing protein
MPAASTIGTLLPTSPKGHLDFKAIRIEHADRISYIGAIPVFNLFSQGFVAPVASAGLSPEVLKSASANGPVQRKTTPAHVQGILDYIVRQAEKSEPWTFNSIVLYSTDPLEFETVSVGHQAAGEARASEAFSVGEGLHRCLAWAVALDLAKVRGVKRPEISPEAQKWIELAAIPVVVIEEKNLRRQKSDFNKLNQQKPLSATVLSLTDVESQLSELTRWLIDDVALFRGRIDLNNASVGAKSDKLLSFAQLRFVAASYLLGKKTRSRKVVEDGINKLVDKRGKKALRGDLKEAFSCVATKMGGLERLQTQKLSGVEAGNVIRKLRSETLLASNAAWRALFVALHDAKDEGVSVEAAFKRVRKDPMIWSRKNAFFKGTLIDRDTGKLLSNRESIEAATDKLLALMLSR